MHTAESSTSNESTNHVMIGFSRLLDPHAVSLLFTSLLSTGHPNRFPSTTLTVAVVARNDDGTFPDKRLTVKVREALGGWYVSTSVPDSLFDDRSTLPNKYICIDTGISPSIVVSLMMHDY